MSAARGAISWVEKSCTVSRIASAVSPRSKLNIRCALGIMVGRPFGLEHDPEKWEPVFREDHAQTSHAQTKEMRSWSDLTQSDHDLDCRSRAQPYSLSIRLSRAAWVEKRL